MPYPGPYTVLKVGDTNVRGYIANVLNSKTVLVQAYGDFEQYASGQLCTGQFQASLSGFNGGDQILFDIAQETKAPYASNIRHA